MPNIEHLIDIKVAPAKVYEALTTEKGLAEVWTTDLKVKSQTGLINEFTFGSSTDRMEIMELTPYKRIEWKVIDSDPDWIGTTISFDLEEDKKGNTLLTLKQTDWKTVNDFFRSCNYHWGFFLYSLKMYCEEGTGIPYQRRKF